MAIRIETDVATLARSRFATSPAFEIVATLRGGRGPAPDHVRRWYARAMARLDAWTADLLHALVPVDHPYVPDFLSPHPRRPRETRDQMVEAILATSAADVRRQLDFAYDGRPVHPEYAATFGSEDAYRRWRRRPPALLRQLIGAGERAVLEEAAEAMGRFYDAAIADEWPRICAVLDADVAFRAEVMTAQGIAAMLGTLGDDITWDGRTLTLPRPFDVDVCWAGDGVLLVPCTAHTGPALFAAERPYSPLLVYAARGAAALWAGPDPVGHAAHLAALLGGTRVRLLDDPRTTQDLSRLDGHAPATVSYHLGLLSRSGLVTGRRGGRGVVYRRTALGDALLRGELPPAAYAGQV